jgi:hypothetical protein
VETSTKRIEKLSYEDLIGVDAAARKLGPKCPDCGLPVAGIVLSQQNRVSVGLCDCSEEPNIYFGKGGSNGDGCETGQRSVQKPGNQEG